MRAKHWLLGTLVAAMSAASVLAMGATVGVSSAAACGAGEVKGQGSTLQKVAQETWIAGSGCTKVTYTATGSAAGLKAFGVGGLETPFGSKDMYVGTDDAPNGTFSTGQLSEMEKAANGTAAEPQDIVVPVAQAAIAVIVKPPTGCSITEISNAALEEAFDGEALTWTAIGATGTTCGDKITRIVRKDGSGTTYQFKHYLFEIDPSVLKCPPAGGNTWAALQEEPTKNLEWPESCEAQALSPLFHAEKEGGGGEAEEVRNEKQVISKEGTIGYAALSDARGKYTDEVGDTYHWLNVETEPEAGVVNFEPPGTSAVEPSLEVSSSNCEGAKYTGATGLKNEEDLNWSTVYGGHPKGNAKYPICTLTWDVALVSYELAGFAGKEVTTKEYLEYVTSTAGQKETEKKDYGKIETVVNTLAKELATLVASK